MPSQEDKTEIAESGVESSVPADQKPAVSKSGRKIKGRGTMRYHTPTRSKSRSASVEERGSSETPPHWKEEMKRTKVYQPPSVERWSKGDKLNDHSSSIWDDRGDSAWSRTPSAEGASDHSSEKSGLQRRQKKQKKKAKHKKKAKKRKHSKKKSSNNKPQETDPSVAERPVSPIRKIRNSRSPTRSSSSRHSPSACPQRRRSSSSSSRYSRSYSRSYTSSRSGSWRGCYSRSRSHSRSRSRSRSRYSSYSRSRSSSRHRSRSRTLSPSRKRSSSRSSRKKKDVHAKPDALTHVTEKLPDSKVTPVSRPTAAPPPENVPVIPLSDSPPPSRWKPGQKPWKPSYFHVPEVKGKIAANDLSSTGQVVDSVTEKPQSSTTAKSLPEDSENDQTSKAVVCPCSRYSRSKSYSRSHSRSRSRSYSRSRSRSPRQYHSRSSSCSRSDSENSQIKSGKEKNPLFEEWKEHFGSKIRINNVNQSSSRDPRSGSGNEEGSEQGLDVGVAGNSASSGNSQESEHCGSAPVESLNNRSEWDSDSDSLIAFLKKQPQTAPPREFPDKKLFASWNSESDSENVTARALAISEKEEGEASSESECDTCRNMPEASTTSVQKTTVNAARRSSEEGPEKVSRPEKRKSKKKSKRKHKRKRRSGNKSSSSRHRKDKGKRSKKKHQKLKETFLWQPPLEFGEEEEEDESKKEKNNPVRGEKERPGVNNVDQSVVSVHKNPSSQEDKGQHRTKECIHKNPKQTEPHQSSSNNANNANSASFPSVKEQEPLDDMDICTPEHDVGIEEPFSFESTSKSSDVANKCSALAKDGSAATSAATAGGLQDEAAASKSTGAVMNFKWRPLKGTSGAQNVPAVTAKNTQQIRQKQNPNAPGVRMEIKSKSRVRPGSLFDEVRKTARLNQRPRNQEESSSEEASPSEASARGASRARSVSSHRSRSRGWSHSSSRSSSSYSSRSRSRSRRRRRRGRSRSRSSTYRRYRSRSRTYSRSHSRSHSHNRHRRSRSDSYDSYSSRSRSASRRRGRRRSHSYRSSGHRSRSYLSSSRSSSRRRSHSRGRRYS